MNSPKILVIALAAVTAAVVAFVFVINPMLNHRGNNSVGRGDVPRIAIITPQTVQVIRSTDRVETTTDTTGATDTQATDTTETPATPAPTPTQAAQGPHHPSAEVAEQMLLMSVDMLSGALSERINQSGRFAVVDPTQVRQVLAEMGRQGPRPRDAKDEDFVTAAFNTLMGENQRDVLPPPPSGGVTVEGSTTRTDNMETSSRTASINSADFSRVASDLNAQYFLAVNVPEPQFENIVRYIAGTSRHVHVVRFDPLISFTLIDASTGTVRLSRNMTIPRPVELVYDDSRPPTGADMRTAYLELWQTVAALIGEELITEVYPAQISVASGDQLVMDRGSADGVQVGDVFEVSRNGATVAGAGDVALRERVRLPVGAVQVTRVQETLAFLSVVSVAQDQEVRQGDRVEFTGSSDTQASGGNRVAQAENAPALGARMRNSAGGAPRPRVAVREALIRFIDCPNCSANDPQGTILSDAFMARFQNEPRVTVMTRRDLEASIQERQLSDVANGQRMRAGEEGMTSAHYLITGTLTVRPEVSVRSERIAGENVEISRSTLLVGTGEFRIFNGETTEVVETASVRVTASGSVSQATLRRLADQAAQTASTEFINRLFPLAVLQHTSDQAIEISGGSQAGLTIGTRLQVYSVGEGVADLYSDQTSQTRTRSGVIVVSDVRRDRATARIEGRTFAIARGDLLEVMPAGQRRATSTPAASQNQPTAPAADRF